MSLYANMIELDVRSRICNTKPLIP